MTEEVEKLTTEHELYISCGLNNPVNTSVFKEAVDTLLSENISDLQSWGVHTKNEYIGIIDEQEEKIKDLQLQIKQLEKQKHNLEQAWHEEFEKAMSYREIARAVNNMESENEVCNRQYWAWMPHEDNHLESLSCPVLIPAEWLRQLLEEKEQLNKKVIDALYFYDINGNDFGNRAREVLDMIQGKEE